MNERDYNTIIYTTTRMTTDQLSDLELAAIGNAAFTGMDPRSVLGYDKAKSLFTEGG